MPRAFIIGGGPSVKGVIGSDIFLKAINKETLFGCNVAPKFFDCEYLVHYDADFLDLRKELRESFKGETCSLATEPISPTPLHGRVYSGNNSGVLGMSCAVNRGYDEIYLLGMDMTKDDNGASHFHNEYSGGKPYGYVSAGEYHAWGFKVYGEWLRNNMPDVRVYNCSGASALNLNMFRGLYPYRSIHEVLVC